ncbi:SRPBCC family protein [Streptomyces sp. NPDC050534]|uniref:SRPBCC family protein n=1 Tax=Streptomyces sp. NPDC050534 TaxID=3365625 RepID=UPI003789B160
MRLKGSGTTRNIVCPYHAWSYGLDGSLRAARRADRMPTFDKSGICLDQVQVEEFGGMVYVNLDTTVAPLSEQAGDLAADIARWAPDVAFLTHAKRLTYDVRSNWKNAYDVSGATVDDHAVWWLWPSTCLLRYPGRGNFMVFQVVPAGPDRTLETWDFFLGTPELTEAEAQSVSYIDDVLQVQDIALVESVQRGMSTPAFDQGRIVYDAGGSGLSEHGVHHFHGLVLDAYRSLAAKDATCPSR